MEEKAGRKGGHAAFLGTVSAGCIRKQVEVRRVVTAHVMQKDLLFTSKGGPTQGQSPAVLSTVHTHTESKRNPRPAPGA